MREIKFRAWDTEQKHMIVDSKISMAGIMSKYIRKAYDPNGKLIGGQYVVMQFAEEKDIDGQDIYDGDIVVKPNDNPISYPDGTVKYDSWFVEFKYGGWRFISTPISPTVSSPSFYSNAKYMKVIGNIHQNPELLEVK